jgi:cobalamin biosynthesis protein CobW
MKGVAVDIITGFLGSGKTSLIKHVLEHGLHNRRVAVVVNDIGDINLDGRVLRGINVDRMVELSNGCICCSISYQFRAAIQEIIETTQAELILIESSGAADPVSLMQEVRNVGLRVDAIITVADGEHICRLYKEIITVRQQVQAADFVVLNKCDLLSDRQRHRTEKFLQRHNPRALLLTSTFGQVDTDLLFATSAQRFRRQHDASLLSISTHLHDDGIEAFTYTSQRPLHRQRFERFLRRLPRDLYRAKGIVCFDQDEWNSILNYTCGRYHVDWFLGKDALKIPPQAVFIGKRLHHHEQRLLAKLTACELDAPSAF